MFPIRDTIPSRNPPVVTVSLIVLNCATFFYELMLPPEMLHRLFDVFGVVPAYMHAPRGPMLFGISLTNSWPLLTSLFLHGGWLHLIGNMWFLWLFGDNVEDRMGHARFLVFYLLSGIAAGITHVALHPGSTVPTIGASGAISGVMGAYLLLFPQAQVVVLVPIFFFIDIWVIPAFLYLGVWFMLQLVSGTLAISAPGTFAGVAFWAHVGGFVAGIVLMPLFLKPRKEYRRWHRDETVYDYPEHFFWR